MSARQLEKTRQPRSPRYYQAAVFEQSNQGFEMMRGPLHRPGEKESGTLIDSRYGCEVPHTGSSPRPRDVICNQTE